MPTPDTIDPEFVPARTHAELLTATEELRVTEEELRQQNLELGLAHDVILAQGVRYQELFNFAPDGYLVTDAHAVIREVNVAAGRLFRRPLHHLVGKPFRVLVYPDDRSRFDALVAHLNAHGSLAGEEVRIGTGPDPVPVALHASTSRPPGGGPASLRWLLHDLSAWKAAEGKLVRTERLAAVGQTAAVLAHESRNALQRAHACLRMLRQEVADRPAAVALADRAGEALTGLTRLLDGVRAAVARPVLRREPCDLAGVWREAWRRVVQAGRTGSLEEAAGGVDLGLVADPDRLGQVFVNLFENALGAGAATVRVAAEPATVRGRPGVRVAVGDDGPGLAPEARKRLFEPFYTTRPDGTGLGLVIAQNIVEAHGGTVAAADCPAGAEFVFTLLRDAS